MITTSLRDDCLILADDFVQYYLGGYTRSDSGAATTSTESENRLATPPRH